MELKCDLASRLVNADALPVGGVARVRKSPLHLLPERAYKVYRRPPAPSGPRCVLALSVRWPRGCLSVVLLALNVRCPLGTCCWLVVWRVVAWLGIGPRRVPELSVR